MGHDSARLVWEYSSIESVDSTHRNRYNLFIDGRSIVHMRHKLPLIALLAFLPIACAPDLGHDDYSTDRPGELSSRFVMGTVTESEPISIRTSTGSKSERTVAGGASGALVGGLLGSAIGSGSGNSGTGALVGALAGGAGGAVLGNVTGRAKGWRIIAKTDSGEMLSSVSTVRLHPGTRVRIEIPFGVERGNGRIRFVPVSHL
jgi:outer membrane lipoprotein SlyB